MAPDALIQIDIDRCTLNCLQEVNLKVVSNVGASSIISRHATVPLLRLKVEKFIEFVPCLFLKILLCGSFGVCPELIRLLSVFPPLLLLVRLTTVVFLSQVEPFAFIV